jgi:hypothetical protein
VKYIADLIHRVSTNRGITTREAAAIRALQGALIGFLAPLIPYFVPVLTGQEHIVWSSEVASSLIGAFIAFVLRLYFAQNDPEIASLLEAYYQAKQRSFLDQSIAPGPGAIQFTVPVTKPVAQPAPSIHDQNTAPQAAIMPTVPVPVVNNTQIKQ